MGHWRDKPPAELRATAERWLAALGDMLAERDFARLPALMHADGYWRDLMTFGWEFKTLRGFDDIRSWLRRAGAAVAAEGFCVEAEPFVGAIGEHRETLEFFFRFETDIGRCRGFVRLIPDSRAPAGAIAFTLLTTMQELKAFPEAVGRNRPHEDMRVTPYGLENWLDRRNAARQFKDRDPDVVIVGGGQSGLMMAARLNQLAIDTLVVERTERIGDIWRKRYKSLKLHNDLCMNHFPYMPFPENWPVYLPKDKLADWFEFYAESMELNVWTGTTCLGGEFDRADKRWTVRLRRDGEIKTMRPRFVVMALGVSGRPNVPNLPGIDEFAGEIVHSSACIDDLAIEGRKVLVVGAGTSAHDIAQYMHLRGAHVTMLQRSSVTVVNLEPSAVRAYQMYRDYEGVRPIADIDLIAACVPFALLAKLHGPLSRSMAEADKELLDGLRKVGFLLDNGEDDTGYFMKLLRYQAGYYLNIGASDLIVAGKIKLKSGVGIERLTARSVVFTDGSAMDADIVVLATGYEPMQESIRAMFGSEIADRVGPVWGIGGDGELRAMYAPTCQEGLFVAGGGFPAARAYSIYTALYMKAALEALLPARPSRASADSDSERSEPELHDA